MTLLTPLLLTLLLLSLLILLISKSAFSLSPLHPLCHHDESSALLQFKSSFVISKDASDPSVAYPKTLSWNPHDDNCCLWDGIECDVETGHVIGLDLSSSYLYGSITSNSTLFHLLHLQKLHLGDNDFNFSRIPDELAHLTALSYLNLSNSVFSGPVPQGISRLSNLVSLDLSDNHFNFSRIPDELAHLTALSYLDLSSSFFSGPVPQGISRLSNLVSLRLSDNPLLQLDKSTFTGLVKNLTHLEKLSLNYIYIPSSLPPQLANLSSLTHLHLYNCSLQGTFLQEIFRLPKLRVLDVGENTNLTGELPEFVSTSQLQVLQLDHTSFSGSLPTSIGNLASLTFISIPGCMFQGPILSSLGNLTNLKYLDLRSNKFIGPIPSSLANLTQLTLMAFAQNKLHHDNYNWLYGHPKLDALYLYETNLIGPFPSAVRNLTELTVLNIYGNQLTGQVPSWLANLTQLTFVNLNRNCLEGQIPRSIRNLYNLKHLILDENHFGGTLTIDTFSNMTKLEFLALGENNLSLQINKNITNSEMKVLDLSHCNLRQFPTFIQKLDSLIVLDLRGNNIGGAIPEWLWKDIRNMQNLRLSGNAFTGTIPPSVCNLHSLNILEVADNNLSGSLPQCLGSLNSEIQLLDFSNNSFEGNISWLFVRGNTLRMIDLSHNRLSGQIPRSLVNCSRLEKLDLSYNQISDTFPSWLGGLSQLRVLGLRSNQLHGKLSIPATKFYFPALRIIDLSHNKLIGELPLEFFEMWRSMIIVPHDLQLYMTIEWDIPTTMLSNSYDYTIELGIKGTNFKHYKIQKAMVYIDLSNNKFEGQIPKSLGALQALIHLNISNNQLSGSIPESMGNLTNVEAMDLSNNKLSGQIPQQLATLTFLAVFNVCDNNLVGPIPQGTQFDGFPNTYFLGNPSLCGRALSIPCFNQTTLPRTGSTTDEEDSDSDSMIKWVIISLGFGSGVVIGVVLGNIFYDRNEQWFAWHIFGQMTTRRTTRKVNKSTGMDQGQRLQPTAGKLVKAPESDKADSLEVELGSVQTRPRAEEDELSSSLLEQGILEEGEIREIEKGKQPMVHGGPSSITST